MLSFPGGQALLFFGEVKRDISTVMIQLRTAGLQWSAFALFGVVSMMCVGCGGNQRRCPHCTGRGDSQCRHRSGDAQEVGIGN